MGKKEFTDFEDVPANAIAEKNEDRFRNKGVKATHAHEMVIGNREDPNLVALKDAALQLQYDVPAGDYAGFVGTGGVHTVDGLNTKGRIFNNKTYNAGLGAYLNNLYAEYSKSTGNGMPTKSINFGADMDGINVNAGRESNKFGDAYSVGVNGDITPSLAWALQGGKYVPSNKEDPSTNVSASLRYRF